MVSVHVSRAVSQHGQRFIHPHHHGFAGTAGEPLHLHFQIANTDAFGGHAVRQTLRFALIAVAHLCQGALHQRDIDKIFIGVPPLAHAFDIQFKGLIGQAGMVKQAHRCSLLLYFLHYMTG
jgi:hypothetical protein